MFKPVTLNVRLLDTAGNPYTGTASVAVSSSRGSQSFTVTGGTAAITQVAGGPVVPSVSYSLSASATGGVYSATSTVVPTTGYPTTLISDVPLTMTAPTATGPLQVKVRDSANNAVAGATVVVSGGPAAVLVTGVTNSSGNVTFTLPGGTTPLYTVLVPAQLGHAEGQTNIAVPSGSTVTSVTVTTP